MLILIIVCCINVLFSISEVFVADSPCDRVMIGGSTSAAGPVTPTIPLAPLEYCSRMKDITNTNREGKEDSSVMDEMLEKFKSGFEVSHSLSYVNQLVYFSSVLRMFYVLFSDS